MSKLISLEDLGNGKTFRYDKQLYIKTAGAIGRGGSSFLAICINDGTAAFPATDLATWQVEPVEVSAVT